MAADDGTAGFTPWLHHSFWQNLGFQTFDDYRSIQRQPAPQY